MMEDSDRYERARRRALELRGFYLHLGIYVLVNVVLFAINMIASAGSLWFYWPLISWGVAVSIHALVVFTEGRFFGDRLVPSVDDGIETRLQAGAR